MYDCSVQYTSYAQEVTDSRSVVGVTRSDTSENMTGGENRDRSTRPRGPMATAATGGGSAAASDPSVDANLNLNFDEDSIEGLLDAEEVQERLLRRIQRQRLLEDVDYWRKRAGWYDDDESMLEYNKGVYDTYYSLDDEYDPSASASSSGGGGGAKNGLGTALKALGVIAGIGVLFVLVRTILRRRSESASDKTKSLSSDDEGGHGRSGRSKSRSGSASRSASRHRRSSSRARSKSVSGRSRSKSVDRRSRSGRSRSRSRRKSGDGGDYDLMGDEEEGRSQRTSRSGRSRSRSGRTRSRSKARSSRQKEEMLV